MKMGTSGTGALDRQESHPGARRLLGWWSLVWLIPLALLLFVVISDLFGWAYLRQPIAAFLSARLDRQVEIGPPFRIHLRPSIPIRVGSLRIAAPQWSQQPHTVDAEGLEADLDWRAILGRQPVLHRLAVARADIRAERDGQGRASWSLGKEKPGADTETAAVIPVIEQLSIGKATITVDDAATDLKLQVEARAGGGGSVAGAAQRPGQGSGQPAPTDTGLVVSGRGSWKTDPVSFELRTKGLRPIIEGGALTDIEVKGKLNSTDLAFAGTVSDLSRFDGINGKVSGGGKSLAELTAIPGLTLPATPPYRLEGDLEKSGTKVRVNVARAEIGSSSMTARLEYDSAGSTPVLRGSLNASRLVLQDLGPSIGALPEASAGKDGKGAKEVKGAKEAKGTKGAKGAKDAPGGKGDGKEAATGKANAPKEKQGQSPAGTGSSRVLPTKEFDLPSLRAMNADVAIDLQRLDLGTDALRPLRSLKAKLLLEGGVLKLQDLKSDLAGGTVTGSAVLDGSRPEGAPVFDARLKWNRVELKNWIAVSNDHLVAGRFSGETLLKGTGKSTASILESLSGTIKGRIDGGSISHQIVELAGLDVAQALGVFLSGDKPLPLSFALVDIAAEKGTLRSNLFLLNTPDTIFFVQGSVNFRNEGLDLRLVQSPKDWSPLSLRSPITVGGTLGDPAIGVEAAPIALKVLSSVVLAAITPLAALLPLIETEDNSAREGCAPAIEQVKRKASELLPERPSPAVADEGAPSSKGGNGNLGRPGRRPGERP